MKAAFDRRVLEVLRPVSAGLAIVFVLAFVVNLMEDLPKEAVTPLLVTKAVLVVAFLLIHAALRRDKVAGSLANALGVGIAALTLLNISLALALVGDAHYTAYIVLVLMGLGSVLLSCSWLVLALAAAIGTWIATAWSFMPLPEMLHYGLALVTASILSVAICLARRRMIASAEKALGRALEEAEQRRQAEESAAKVKDRLSLAISASKGAWWFIAFDSENPEQIPDKIELDPALKAFIGFDDQELPNSRQAWHERVFHEDLEMVQEASLAHLRGDTSLHETRYRIWHKDGSLRWIYSCGRIERDAQGKPLGASGIAWDVTERMESENRLRKLSRAVEQSSSLLVITDTEGKIEYVNPKFTRTTGYTLDEVVGKTPAILRSTNSQPELFEELWSTILSGEEWQGEFQNLKKSGEPYWVMASISPIRDRDGEITHFVAVQEDITERRKVESQLFQAQKMEGIGQLVSGVAHDFNNLLTGIVGFADMSLEMVERDSPLRVNLEQISKAGESAMSLTRQLLTFSRQQPSPPRAVDLNEVVGGFEKLLRRTIGEDVALETMPAAEPALASGDPSQIEQILVNLAVNARDAMPDGGLLRIEISDSDLQETSFSQELELAPGRYVTLAVSDSGHGMDEATSRRIFEPFFTTKERGRGTGLGLSTVYGIVKQGGGYIEVDSAIGKGTTFRIHFPRATESVDQSDEVEQPTIPGKSGERVLLVEDDDPVRAFAVKLLEQNGYQVVEAASALEALENRKSSDIDLLITDVVMPGMNGVELAERLARTLPEMKVLFLSGYADREIVEKEILEAGATFLAKPFAVDIFVQTVRDLLDT